MARFVSLAATVAKLRLAAAICLAKLRLAAAVCLAKLWLAATEGNAMNRLITLVFNEQSIDKNLETIVGRYP